MKDNKVKAVSPLVADYRERIEPMIFAQVMDTYPKVGIQSVDAWDQDYVYETGEAEIGVDLVLTNGLQLTARVVWIVYSDPLAILDLFIDETAAMYDGGDNAPV